MTNYEAFTQAMVERGEFFRLTEERRPGIGRDFDIRHLFHGHCIDTDEFFSISATRSSSEESLTAKVKLSESREFSRQESLFEYLEDNLIREIELLLEWNFDRESEELRIPLSIEGGISTDYGRRFRSKNPKNTVAKTQFVSSSSLSIPKMIEMFDQVVLKPEEDSVIQALKNIDATVERIASLGTDRYVSGKRGGFVIKRRGEQQPVPIGTMGDGIWRMLGLALAAVSTRDGILLVDEIDTGLHFTTMIDMWRMILETSKRLNIQVFATTHSRDCWESLAAVAEAENAQDNEIIVHRLEKEKSESITFNPRQIEIAAERGIEVH